MIDRKSITVAACLTLSAVCVLYEQHTASLMFFINAWGVILLDKSKKE